MRPTSDRELLDAARGGDDDAGRLLVERFGATMLRTAWSVLGRYAGSEAEDVVQESLVAALSTPSLPTGDVGAWLRAITVRKALDWLRGPARGRERELPEPGGPGDPRAPAADEPSVRVLELRRALGRLSPLDRAVLVLADLEGRSMAEVAGIVGSTRVAVKLRASRARRRLARLLGSGVAEVQR